MLTRRATLTVCPAQGAFYVMPDLSAYTGAGVEAPGWGPVPDTDALCMFVLERGLVACVPGEAFGCPGTLRISYACSLETLTTALDRIEGALRQLPAWTK